MRIIVKFLKIVYTGMLRYCCGPCMSDYPAAVPDTLQAPTRLLDPV